MHPWSTTHYDLLRNGTMSLSYGNMLEGCYCRNWSQAVDWVIPNTWTKVSLGCVNYIYKRHRTMDVHTQKIKAQRYKPLFYWVISCFSLMPWFKKYFMFSGGILQKWHSVFIHTELWLARNLTSPPYNPITLFPRFSTGSQMSVWSRKSAGSKVIVLQTLQMSTQQNETQKKAPGPNERRGTEDFDINECRGAHSGTYGICNLSVSKH